MINVEVQIRNLKVLREQRKNTRNDLLIYIQENINQVKIEESGLIRIRDKMNRDESLLSDIEIIVLSEYIWKNTHGT